MKPRTSVIAMTESTIREDITGVFRERDESHPKIKIISDFFEHGCPHPIGPFQPCWKLLWR